MHARLMIVEKQHQRSGRRNDGENPSGPPCFQDSALALQFDETKAEQQNRKYLVLQNFRMVSQSEIPALRTERPKFRVAENKEENARSKKTDWPHMASNSPTLPNASVGQDQEPGDEHK
jgi:hypothetical protein